MGENLLSISKQNISIKNFKSSDFKLKDSTLYHFSDALENEIENNQSYGSTTTLLSKMGDSSPKDLTKSYVSAGALQEYPPYLNDLFTTYAGNALYFPLGSNLSGYKGIPSENVETLEQARFNYNERQKTPSNITLGTYPSFYDGMSSYADNNYFKIKDSEGNDTAVNFYTDSARSTVVNDTNYLVLTPYFMTRSVIQSSSSTLTVYSDDITIDTKSKYCLSFYTRKVSKTKATDTLTLNCYVNNNAVTGKYFTDKNGYSDSSVTISDMWERVSYIFDGVSGTVRFVINIPATTKIGGFLLEPTEQSSLYDKVLVNELPKTYHPMAIYFYNGVDMSLKNDWTISYTKVGGQAESCERIGNLIITENLNYSEDKGRIDIKCSKAGDDHGITFEREKSLNDNFDTRRFTFVYTASSNRLEVYVSFNKSISTVHDIWNCVADSLPAYVDNTFTDSTGTKQSWRYHIILGGTSPTNICSGTRYRDLVYINKALTQSEIIALENKTFAITSGKSKYECTTVYRKNNGNLIYLKDSDGNYILDENGKVQIKKDVVEETKTTTYLLSSMIINKEL